MRRILLLVVLLIATSIPGVAFPEPAINFEIAPQKKLRVAMNANTPVLLTRTKDQIITGGVGLELGKFIARKLGVVLELHAHTGSASFIQSFGKGNGILDLGQKRP